MAGGRTTPALVPGNKSGCFAMQPGPLGTTTSSSLRTAAEGGGITNGRTNINVLTCHSCLALVRVDGQERHDNVDGVAANFLGDDLVGSPKCYEESRYGFK